MEEIWKEIPNYDGMYLISDLGRVKSLKNNKEIFIKLCPNNKGYLTFNLNKNNKSKLVKPHRLVAELFIPNPENKPQVNHINGIKDDNRVENLEWNTQSENQIHAFKNNLISRNGIKNSQSKLTENQVREIKNLGLYDTYSNIAKKYNVNSGCIWLILNNVAWKHIV